MRSIKRGIAVMLSLLLMVPAVPVHAEEVEAGVTFEGVIGEAAEIPREELAEEEVSAEENAEAVSQPAPAAGEVSVNTGGGAYVVKGSDSEHVFDENGNYTIEIPEVDPFFPYEVQFSYEGNTWEEWFMAPDSSVTIGGHVFTVNPNFSGNPDVVTQMTLDVSGSKVVVYPVSKFHETAISTTEPTLESEETDEIIRDEAFNSLIKLNTGSFTADLSDFTPIELTMVSVGYVFSNGKTNLSDGQKVIWAKSTYQDTAASNGNPSYTISSTDDKINLLSSNYYEMIVGNADQLSNTNVRYKVSLSTNKYDWLTSTVYTQDINGNRSQATIERSYSTPSMSGSGISVDVYCSGSATGATDGYLKLAVNSEMFPNPRYNRIRVFEGKYNDASQAETSNEITDQIFNSDMSQKDAGFPMQFGASKYVTFVTYDGSGSVTGCLPGRVTINNSEGSISTSIYKVEDASTSVTSIYKVSGDIWDYELYSGYPASWEYLLKMGYSLFGASKNTMVTAAFEGNFDSIAAANAAGAKNIKASLFGEKEYYGYAPGYKRKFADGIPFTVFIGDDGAGQTVIHRTIKVHDGDKGKSTSGSLSDSTYVTFTGLRDAAGNPVKSFFVHPDRDSFADKSYLTILTSADTDISNVAPEFSMTDDGMNLYATENYNDGKGTQEESGKSYHNFSNGPVQYTAASESKDKQKNYWVQIVKVGSGPYINSFKADGSDTTNEGGVIKSKREIMLNSFSMYHDILLANMGVSSLASPGVTLDSSNLELDAYWTLKGQNDLGVYDDTSKDTDFSDNLALIRVRAKEGVKSAEISGTLTITSAGSPVVVLNLTGEIGDPVIKTESVPNAVKYVSYGAMIQNNNKYAANKVSYSITDGALPSGMELHNNGEIYGIPMETGTFTFTVTMNQSSPFKPSTATLTLTVVDNTDPNVDGATDSGYDLTDRVDAVLDLANLNPTYRMRSLGILPQKKRVTLDGEDLQEGTDYEQQDGSTIITIQAQTFRNAGEGRHTLNIEFRDDNNEVRRAAQNYVTKGTVKEETNKPADNEKKDENKKDDGSSQGNNSDSNSDNSGSDSGSSGDNSSSGAGSQTPVRAPANVGNVGTTANTASIAGASVHWTTQGPLAMAAFNSAITTDYRIAGTFNLLVNGVADHRLKSGRFVLNIREDLIKHGRIFALIAVDKNGQPHRFNDLDNDERTLTVDLNVEAYAFALVYTDGAGAQTVSATPTSGVYVVKVGDTLSKIARMISSTVANLVQRNGIADPNKINVGQQIQY